MPGENGETTDAKKAEYERKMKDGNMSPGEISSFLTIAYAGLAYCERCQADQDKFNFYPKSDPKDEVNPKNIIFALRNEGIKPMTNLKTGCFLYEFADEVKEIDGFLESCSKCECKEGHDHMATLVGMIEYIGKTYHDMKKREKDDEKQKKEEKKKEDHGTI